MRIREYNTIRYKSAYHVSIGSMLRQQKVSRKKKLKKAAATIALISSIIIMAILAYSTAGISYIATDVTPKIIDTAPMVTVEGGFIAVRDNDLQWFLRGYHE